MQGGLGGLRRGVSRVVNAPTQPQDTQFETWPGELLSLRVDNVLWLDKINLRTTTGDIFLTNYRFIFQTNQAVKMCSIPLTAIAYCEKIGGKSSPIYEVGVHQKNLRVMYFRFDKKKSQRARLVSGLNSMLNRETISLSAFVLMRHTTYDNNGWNVYNTEKEYQRIGIFQGHPQWRISSFNRGHDEIPSYPDYIVVPRLVLDPALQGACKNRTRGRIPALVWLSPDSQAGIVRCSQPAVGLRGTVLRHDKELIRAISSTNQERPLIIIDARSKSAAVANMAVGGGYEDYGGDFRIFWMNIANIHVIRESLDALRKSIISRAIEDNSINGGKLGISQWLDHVQLILYGVATTVQFVEQRKTVLVHCSDGWDRTPQLTGSSMLCLDPYYRTFEGFQVLIEKEWCAFGHKFSQRNGHELTATEGNNQERSPIFLQWMDVVYQLLRQFPVAFEFNHRLLITIIDAVYECKFGTFLFDTPKERQSYNVATTTTSLWSYVNDANVKGKFLNPFYEPDRYAKNPILRCSPHREDIRFWRTFYLRWFRHVGDHDTYDLLEKRYADIAKERDMMEREIRELKRRLGEDAGGGVGGYGARRAFNAEEEEEDETWEDVDQFINNLPPQQPLPSDGNGAGEEDFTFERRPTVGERSRARATSHVAWSNLERQRQNSSTFDASSQQQQEPPEQQIAPLFSSEDAYSETNNLEDSSNNNNNKYNNNGNNSNISEADDVELSQKAMERLVSMYQRLERERSATVMQLNSGSPNADVLKSKLDHLQTQQAQIQVMMQQVSTGTAANSPRVVVPTPPAGYETGPNRPSQRAPPLRREATLTRNGTTVPSRATPSPKQTRGSVPEDANNNNNEYNNYDSNPLSRSSGNPHYNTYNNYNNNNNEYNNNDNNPLSRSSSNNRSFTAADLPPSSELTESSHNNSSRSPGIIRNRTVIGAGSVSSNSLGAGNVNTVSNFGGNVGGASGGSARPALSPTNPFAAKRIEEPSPPPLVSSSSSSFLPPPASSSFSSFPSGSAPSGSSTSPRPLISPRGGSGIDNSSPSLDDLLAGLTKNASLYFSTPEAYSGAAGDQLRIKLLVSTRQIESKMDRNKNARLIASLMSSVSSFVDATKQGDVDACEDAFTNMMSVIQICLESSLSI